MELMVRKVYDGQGFVAKCDPDAYIFGLSDTIVVKVYINARGERVMLNISEISTGAPGDVRSSIEMEVYGVLGTLKIPYERVDHEAAGSMEDCVEIERILNVEISKNIFLCNRQKTDFYLLVMPASKPFVTKDFSERMGCARVSFAPAEKMEELLGVTPGSATIMALINDKEQAVQLIIDKEVADSPWFGCNPGNNTSHIKFSMQHLLNDFIPYTKHQAKIIML